MAVLFPLLAGQTTTYIKNLEGAMRVQGILVLCFSVEEEVTLHPRRHHLPSAEGREKSALGRN